MLPSPGCDAICLIYSLCLPEAEWACVCECLFSHVHDVVALSTEIYCSLGDKEPFVREWHFIWTGTLPPFVLSQDCPFVIQQRINSSKGWLSITQLASPFPLSLATSESAVTLRCSLTRRSRYADGLVDLLSVPSVMSGQAEMWQHLSPFCLSWGLQGPCAGADWWLSQPEG